MFRELQRVRESFEQNERTLAYCHCGCHGSALLVRVCTPIWVLAHVRGYGSKQPSFQGEPSNRRSIRGDIVYLSADSISGSGVVALVPLSVRIVDEAETKNYSIDISTSRACRCDKEVRKVFGSNNRCSFPGGKRYKRCVISNDWMGD